MTLVPIIFTSLLVVGGFFVLILSVSFVSYKIKSRNKPKPYQVVNKLEIAKKNGIISEAKRKNQQALRLTQERIITNNEKGYYASDLAEEQKSRERAENQALRSKYEFENRRVSSSIEYKPDENTEKSLETRETKLKTKIRNNSKPRLTVINDLHKNSDLPITAKGSGDFNKVFNADFNLLKYYADE